MARLAEISLGDKNFKKYKALTPEIYKKTLMKNFLRPALSSALA